MTEVGIFRVIEKLFLLRIGIFITFLITAYIISSLKCLTNLEPSLRKSKPTLKSRNPGFADDQAIFSGYFQGDR